MKSILVPALLSVAFFLPSHAQSEEAPDSENCPRVVYLHGYDQWAKELGVTVAEAKRKVTTINLWEKPSSEGKGKKVGEAAVGSINLLLEEGPDDYRIKSTADGSIGWVSKIQVAGVSRANVQTGRECD